MADQDEWMWGWDPTPGIVSVWAEPDGRAFVWRRVGRELVRDDERYEPWAIVGELSCDPRALAAARELDVRELAGPGALRYLVRARDQRTLTDAILGAAAHRAGTYRHVRDLPAGDVLLLPPEEQYLVATGRAYFRDLPFDDLRRMQIDLETTGLDAERDRIFVIAVRDPSGAVEILAAHGERELDEAELIARLVARVRAVDPDVIENHNLHGFDLPFLETRARILGVPLVLGRWGAPGVRPRGARRGTRSLTDPTRRTRYTVPGREMIDTLDAVARHDFTTRDLPGHGLKAVARHLGLAAADRELIPGAEIYATWKSDPARVERYAGADVEEVAQLSRLLGGAAYALAQMVPRRYERLAETGPATGMIDPLLVRAYVRAGLALPIAEGGDGTEHTGAGLYVFATGVARRIVKADVASLYPSLMREFRIGPRRDRLGVMLALVDRWVEQRLAAKAAARAAPPQSQERYRHEAMSAAMKLVVNSAYGYLGAGQLTRFSDVHAANEVTAHGRATLATICRELAARGLTLIEADTDGVYASAPADWTEADERRAVAEAAAVLPAKVALELDGRYAAMLSHEPKNYALQRYGDGELILRGVAFRSSRAERFGEHFLRVAIARLFAGDVVGVRELYLATVDQLRRRALPTRDVTALARLTKTPADYAATRELRREHAYEAMLASGRTSWEVGERVRVYRAAGGAPAVWSADEDGDATGGRGGGDARDYDGEHYARALRELYASRLARALAPEDFEAVFADPDQLQLFQRSLADARPILTILPLPDALGGGGAS